MDNYGDKLIRIVPVTLKVNECLAKTVDDLSTLKQWQNPEPIESVVSEDDKWYWNWFITYNNSLYPKPEWIIEPKELTDSELAELDEEIWYGNDSTPDWDVIFPDGDKFMSDDEFEMVYGYRR